MIKRIIFLEGQIGEREKKRYAITQRAIRRRQMLTEKEIRQIVKLESDNVRDQAEVRALWYKLAES